MRRELILRPFAEVMLYIYMSIINKIKAYEQEISLLGIPANLTECLNCGGDRQAIKIHAYRERIFLGIVGNLVQKIYSFLSRWKCLLCQHTFTYYPDFILPYKRYLKDDISKFSCKYLGDDNSTYKKVVCFQGLAIGYASEKEKTDEKQFTGSTVWRWISFLGSQEKLINKSFDLIRQKSPSSLIFRQIPIVPPRKYRSLLRRKLLVNAYKYFQVENEFLSLFSLFAFTKLATRFKGS